MREQLSRRRVLIGTGALAAATTSGIALTSDNTSATVSGSYTIPDSQTVLADTELQDVRLQVDADYSFTSNAPVHGVEIELHVGASPETLQMIARHERTDLGTMELTGEQALSGSILNTDVYSVDDFQPTSGELSTNVMSELRLYVIRNDEVVAEATQSEAFAVTVKNEELQVDTSVGGSGEVVFESG